MPPARGTGADTIGTLSVDILADLSQFDTALTAVEQKLGKVKTDITVRIGITEAQLNRLKTAADLIERIQKTGVSGLNALGAATAPAGGRGGAAGRQNVNVSLKEADLTQLFRKAAEAAFAQPIAGVKLQLDIPHLQAQLQQAGLRLPVTGETSHGGPAAPASVANVTAQSLQRVIPGLKEALQAPKVVGAIDDMIIALNAHAKAVGGQQFGGSTPEEKFLQIADRLGSSVKEVVSLGKAEGPYGRPITGGALAQMLSGAGDDLADKLEDAGRSFYERISRTPAFDLYRQAGGRPAAQQQAAYAPTGAQQQAATQATIKAADAQVAATRQMASQQAAVRPQAAFNDPSRLAPVTRSIEQIDRFAREVANAQGYRRTTGALTQPWASPQREFVAGRRAHGPRGLTAYGPVGTSGGVDITDILMAGGPGARLLEQFGEVMQGNRGTGEFVTITPEEREALRQYPRQTGPAAGRINVRATPPRELLEKILISQRGVSGEEAKSIASWALRSGGPLSARELGPNLGGDEGPSLFALMSAGGGAFNEDTRRALRQQQLQREIGGLQTGLAETGVPSEARRIRAQIANRKGQLKQLQMRAEAESVIGALNRQRIEEEAINPESQFRTRFEDQPTLQSALVNLGQYRGQQESFHAEIANIRDQLLGGFLPPGDQPSSVGAMTGARTSGTQLHSAAMQLVGRFREEVGIEPTRKKTFKSAVAQLEREGFPMEAAALSMLFGERGTRATLAEAAISSYPQRSGLTEARLTGLDAERRGTVGPGETIPGGMTRGGRHVGDVMAGPLSPRMQRVRDQLEREQAALDRIFGRSGSVKHDPMAAGMPSGWWEQAGLPAEGRIMGAHPQVRIGQVGEMDMLKQRVRERVARQMGVRFGASGEDAGKPIMPNSGAVTEAQFEAAAKAALESDPSYQEFLEASGGQTPDQVKRSLEERTRKMRRILRRGSQPGYYRTQAPPVMSGDEARIRYFEQSGMAPQGGVPLTPDVIRRMELGPTSGQPAVTLSGAGSTIGAVPPPGGGGRGTAEGAPAGPMGHGVVHVWIDGPFPLRVSGGVGGGRRTGRGGAIERAMAEGDVAEAQRLNIAEGMARGASPGTGGAVRTTLADFQRELHRARTQLLLPAQAGPSGGLGVTQAAPTAAAMRMAQMMPAGAVVLGAAPGGGGGTIITNQQARQAAQAAQAVVRQTARASRAPTPAQLAAALAGAGMEPEDIAATIARPGRVRREPRDIETIINARQMAREATGNLAQRALGTTMIQLVQNALGGRAAPTQRILQLQRETAQVQQMATGIPRLDEMRRQAGAQYAQGLLARQQLMQSGRAVPDELTRSIKANKEQFDTHTKAMRRLEANVETAGKALLKMETTRPTDIMRNLGAGFLGGIAGGFVTMGVSAAISAVGAIGGIGQKVVQPGFEQAIGYQNVTNRVIDSLSDQVRANYGLAQSTVALKAAQSGLSAATYAGLRPTLEQAATIEAGNKAYMDYIDLIRAARRTGEGGAPRGLFQTTGGFNLLGLQTPFFGTPSTTENFLNQFQGAGFKSSFGLNGTQTSTDFFGNLFNNIGTVGDAVNAVVNGDISGLERRAQQLGQTRDRAEQDINDQLEKIGSTFRVKGGQAGAGVEAFVSALQRAGVDEGKIDQVRGLGLEFTDSAGNIITNIDQINAALMDWNKSLTAIDPKVFLQTLTGPAGGLTASVFGLQQQAALSRQSGSAQFALGRLVSPPVRLDQVLAGLSNVPGAFRGAGPGPAGPNPLIVQGLQAQGEGNLQSILSAIGDPAAQQQAQQMIALATQAGAAIHDLQVQSQQIQMGAMFRGMARDVELAKRSVSDLVGITGQSTATMQNGTRIEGSQIGILERQNMLISRRLQLLQFEQQERQLNYQVALAGFMAEGATGEERAARLESAEKAASVQRELLQGQRDLADNSWQVQQLQNTRAFEDAMYQANELVRRLDDTAALARIDDKIQQWQTIRDFGLEQTQQYLAQGQGMIQLSIGVGQQLLQLGATVAESIGLAAQGMRDAITTLGGVTPTPTQEKPWWETGDIPGPFNLPAGGPGGVTPLMLGAKGAGVNVQIINPQAGVDTQALTRVVISELNRQAALRGLQTVGG